MDEQEGGRETFYAPSHPEHPDAALLQLAVERALGELPKRLRMTAEEVRALLSALREADGNVSEAARVSACRSAKPRAASSASKPTSSDAASRRKNHLSKRPALAR